MEFVSYHTENRIGFITLKRAEKRNALNAKMVLELKQSLKMAESSKETKVVIVRAEGSAFCAGADLAYLKQLQDNTYSENLEDSTSLKELFYRIYTLNKIVIAQIQGHAIAGGCGLASVCDFAFSVPDAKFGYTEVKIGFIPAIVMVFLIRKVGEHRAKELLITGNLINAGKAVEFGLINWVVKKDMLEQATLDFANKLVLENSEQSMELTKKMIGLVQSQSLEDALDYAAEMNARARANIDCQDGITAFLNKEKITW